MEKALSYVGIAVALILALSFLGDALSQTFKEIGCTMAGEKVCVIQNPNNHQE